MLRALSNLGETFCSFLITTMKANMRRIKYFVIFGFAPYICLMSAMFVPTFIFLVLSVKNCYPLKFGHAEIISIALLMT